MEVVQMDVMTAIDSRKTTRAFLNKPVPKKDILEILNAARLAPSGSNLQPWNFWAVTGKDKDELVKKLLDEQNKVGITYSPGRGRPLNKRYIERSNSFAMKILPYIERAGINDPNWIIQGSLSFYGAPVVILILFDEESYSNEINLGLALQNILLSAHNKGLGTCPLGLPLAFGELIRDHLKIPKNLKISNIVAIGYADTNNPINEFKSERVSLEEITKLIGFDKDK